MPFHEMAGAARPRAGVAGLGVSVRASSSRSSQSLRRFQITSAITGIGRISGAKYGRATQIQFRGVASKFATDMLYLEAPAFGLDRFAEAAAHRNGFVMAPGRLVMGSNLT